MTTIKARPRSLQLRRNSNFTGIRAEHPRRSFEKQTVPTVLRYEAERNERSMSTADFRLSPPNGLVAAQYPNVSSCKRGWCASNQVWQLHLVDLLASS